MLSSLIITETKQSRRKEKRKRSYTCRAFRAFRQARSIDFYPKITYNIGRNTHGT